MRLHTKLMAYEVRAALLSAQRKGLITPDVEMTVFKPGRSMTHRHAYEIQLGTYDQNSLPAGYTDQNGYHLRVRRARNASHGEARWAATWHEWGWLIAEIFAADPDARWGPNPTRSSKWNTSGYASPADFRVKTDGQFQAHLQNWTPPACTAGGNLVIPVPEG